ncbi:MAG: hypothetical protein WCY97_08355 [Methanothrix sp.]|jgi:hypothetical protein|uniref:Uncharacterized protein n=1 Tax=Methanothrix harundinacea TaxID=301375 RepID=A0A101FU64_9EURY|nr:MAG: Uncharacterized protein XD72_1218 [Methanothrix harundinacea]MCP1392087.1 hypothetical protein [Methanothrix harundinacea]MDD3710839.1 hypothetical protein [Methanothrix sp.]MDD5769149.1 hypothetical protein [Methanothrix sp.]MDI9398070.1 hypothetical protein [Euryarchaeota archaeon]
MFIRTVIVLSFVALLVASVSAYGVEPVSVGGDFGISWLKNLPSPPKTSIDDGGGLWSWGGAPSGMTVVNGSLVPEDDDNDEIDLADIEWLWTELRGPPVMLNKTRGPMDFLYPFYSDDPWFLSQHYERLILVPEDYYD